MCMKKMAVFFDSSCFPTLPSSDIQYMMDHCDNFIITPVVDEIKKGQINHPTQISFALILDNLGKLKKEFNEISLADYNKDDTYKFDVDRLMLLKKNPLLCSAYYTWIISATNPATIHDWHRHIYNEIVASI